MRESGEARLSIGEVARRVGMRTSALRFYESAGLLDPPARRGGQRRYGPTVLQRLAIIELGQRAGFTIAEIRELLAGTAADAASDRWRDLAQRKLPEIRALIQRAQEMERWLEEGLRCACLRLEDCRLVANMPAAASMPTKH